MTGAGYSAHSSGKTEPGPASAGHRIAVISDTHNMLRPEAAEVIKTCEAVLHGGDISGPETLEKIRKALAGSDGPSGAADPAGKLFVVRGNNDRDWAAEIPCTLETELWGRKFFMTHKKKDIPPDVDADVVIYGHSHRYAQDYRDGILFLNPGSCGPRRFGQAITMAVLTVPDPAVSEGGSGPKSYGITVEKIEIPHMPAGASGNSAVVKKEQVTADLIRRIGTDLEKHRTVLDIAARRNISADLAEQIVRLYVTHPGVTAEQIMSKMGL